MSEIKRFWWFEIYLQRGGSKYDREEGFPIVNSLCKVELLEDGNHGCILYLLLNNEYERKTAQNIEQELNKNKLL